MAWIALRMVRCRDMVDSFWASTSLTGLMADAVEGATHHEPEDRVRREGSGRREDCAAVSRVRHQPHGGPQVVQEIQATRLRRSGGAEPSSQVDASGDGGGA